ncbi:hypothetical protein B0H11DRAFT_1147731 [Mycena galericulata]|nr:hypothetical protein B0H11DRAFT_1147731 [Mycena galericulata]
MGIWSAAFVPALAQRQLNHPLRTAATFVATGPGVDLPFRPDSKCDPANPNSTPGPRRHGHAVLEKARYGMDVPAMALTFSCSCDQETRLVKNMTRPEILDHSPGSKASNDSTSLYHARSAEPALNNGLRLPSRSESRSTNLPTVNYPLSYSVLSSPSSSIERQPKSFQISEPSTPQNLTLCISDVLRTLFMRYRATDFSRGIQTARELELGGREMLL